MCKGQNVERLQPAAPKERTIQKLRDQIPAQYFQRSTLRSLSYVVRDLVQAVVTFSLTAHVLLPFAERTGSSVVVGAVWALYWWVQGLNLTGLWVLAHECGHRGFSSNNVVNDMVGMVLHSFLLVPYHSWRFSHRDHHMNTNHIFKDTVFLPKKKRSVAAAEAISETPLATLTNIFFMLLLGWPMYLFFNLAGKKYERRANHFEPHSPVFAPGDRQYVVQSNCVLAAVVGGLGYAVRSFGWAPVLAWYGVPYLMVNMWLVLITYLQHTDYRVPHYNNEEWTYVRGALSTVDGDFGWLINEWLHHINDSHVVHHLFSTMPHYNAIEVTTKYMAPLLGEHYLYDSRPIPVALWESFRKCHAVVPDEGVAYYH